MRKDSSEIEIRLRLPTSHHAKTFVTAIQPEIGDERSTRYHVYASSCGRDITLRIAARDLTALRAAVNTYLRYVNMWWRMITSLGRAKPAASSRTASSLPPASDCTKHSGNPTEFITNLTGTEGIKGG